MPKRPLLALALIAAPWLALGLACAARPTHSQVVYNDGRSCRVVRDPGGSVWRPNPYARCPSVRIEGLCASQCTVDLFRVRDRACLTPGAVLAFHQPYADLPGRRRTYLPGLASYPSDVQAWLDARGGLPRQFVEMSPREAARYLRRC